MVVVYFDSSALVKLLVEEEGSDLAAALWDGCDAAVSSRLAYPEVRAALAAAGRAHRLGAADVVRAGTAWERYWAAIRVVEVSEQVARRAGELTDRYALRGADAVHLASLMVFDVEQTVLAAWDQRLRAGAQAAGAQLAPSVPS